jgi:L-threonylcarbamoyladenylate synthase
MEIITNPTQVEIKKAAQALKDGYLVAFPTETVYGLGADATNGNAISRVYSVKARPTDHPLIVHISSITQFENLAVDVPKYARTLAKKFWPGPLTLIVKKSSLVSDQITAGQPYVGLRIPSHPTALAFLKEFEKLSGLGVAAPSANRFGAVSPTDGVSVLNEIGKNLSRNDIILDAGKCELGLESTIINCSQQFPTVLRPGWVTIDFIERTLGHRVESIDVDHELKASGLLKSHYAPKARVFLDIPANIGDGFIAMDQIPTPEGAIRLASPMTIENYASQIYSALRQGDALNLKNIIVVQPQGNGLALAIRDRLGKAAAK